MPKELKDLTAAELRALAQEDGIDVGSAQSQADLVDIVGHAAEEAIERGFRQFWDQTRLFESTQNEMIRLLGNLQGPQPSIELAHARADGLLCWLLTRLGFKRVVEEWQRVDKFYG
jgi:hypothetical protein